MTIDATEFIDSLPWGEVTHAYGVATDAPAELRRLLSQDEDERMDAICGFLLSSAFHQYSIYPATPYVIQSVVRILEEGTVNHLDSGMGDSMASQLLNFISICAERGQTSIEGRIHPYGPTIEDATMSAIHLYQTFSEDADPNARENAGSLLTWATKQTEAQQAAP